MPMKMPVGPEWLRQVNLPIPNLMMAGSPGFERVATALMKKTFKSRGAASIEELRELCVESDVKVVDCQMTVDVFGFSKDDFIPQMRAFVGATSFLPYAQKTDVSLFI